MIAANIRSIFQPFPSLQTSSLYAHRVTEEQDFNIDLVIMNVTLVNPSMVVQRVKNLPVMQEIQV